jgi:hypothetical protein
MKDVSLHIRNIVHVELPTRQVTKDSKVAQLAWMEKLHSKMQCGCSSKLEGSSITLASGQKTIQEGKRKGDNLSVYAKVIDDAERPLHNLFTTILIDT